MLFLIPIFVAVFTVTTATVAINGGARLADVHGRINRRKQEHEQRVADFNGYLAWHTQEMSQFGLFKKHTWERVDSILQQLTSLNIDSSFSFTTTDGTEFSYAETSQNWRLKTDRAKDVIQSIISSVSAGGGTYALAMALVGAIGTASTGAAISSLGGAAFSNAAFSLLGGGTIAAGGFGVAGGLLVASGIFIAPVLLITGFTLHGEAEKAETQLEEYNAETSIIEARLVQQKQKMEGILHTKNQMTHSIQSQLNELNSFFDESTQQFKEPLTEDRIRICLILIDTLINLLETPIQ